MALDADLNPDAFGTFVADIRSTWTSAAQDAAAMWDLDPVINAALGQIDQHLTGMGVSFLPVQAGDACGAAVELFAEGLAEYADSAQSAADAVVQTDVDAAGVTSGLGLGGVLR